MAFRIGGRAPSPYDYPARDIRMAQLTQQLPEDMLERLPEGSGMLERQPAVPTLSLADARIAKPGFFRKGGIGRNLLGNVIGSVGDALAGNNAFAQGQLQRQKLLWEETAEARKRQAEYEDAVRLLKAKQEFDVPEVAATADYWRRQGRDDIAEDIIAKSRLVPIQRADEATGEIRTEYVRPSSLFGGEEAGPAMRITTREQYDALPPGTPYVAPDGSRRVKGGQ
jgi:hypothetical protein